MASSSAAARQLPLGGSDFEPWECLTMRRRAACGGRRGRRRPRWCRANWWRGAAWTRRRPARAVEVQPRLRDAQLDAVGEVVGPARGFAAEQHLLTWRLRSRRASRSKVRHIRSIRSSEPESATPPSSARRLRCRLSRQRSVGSGPCGVSPQAREEEPLALLQLGERLGEGPELKIEREAGGVLHHALHERPRAGEEALEQVGDPNGTAAIASMPPAAAISCAASADRRPARRDSRDSWRADRRPAPSLPDTRAAVPRHDRGPDRADRSVVAGRPRPRSR